MRIREQKNYKAFFTNTFKTVRLTDGEPTTPELLDVAINDKCLANCSYCYTNALKSGNNFENIVDKAKEIWGSQELNDRPFQTAIGGAGEPTLHPDFSDFVKYLRSIDIIPNYTTNGMHLSKEVLESTEKYCGGVALSWHPHIEKVFHDAIIKLSSIKTKINTHIIIGTEKSLNDLKLLYSLYEHKFEYFVILPYQAVGRGQKLETKDIWIRTFEWINTVNSKKFAFGALFYNFLKENDIPLEMSIYNPDIYSGYVLLNNNYKKIYKSSYELTEKNINRN
jgi:MoaA/NifB/PqqE/SkfB family radical SAM enzyme